MPFARRKVGAGVKHRFQSRRRIRTGPEFHAVFQARTSVADGLIVVYGLENDAGFSRLGLSVSRKVGGAVTRNRWKRVLREAFRLNVEQMPPGLDYVIVPRAVPPPSMPEAAESLVRLSGDLLRRIRNRKSPNRRPAERDHERKPDHKSEKK